MHGAECDLDEYGKLLWRGDLRRALADWQSRIECIAKGDGSSSDPVNLQEAEAAVSQYLYGLRWGPTQVPIYNLLGLFMLIRPQHRSEFIDIAEFLIEFAKVPVDGPDLSGTTALSHCFSTKPAFDLKYAQMLYNAGGDVNNRDRYGGTVAHEIIKTWEFKNPKVVQRAMDALEWFLNHDGNVDIADGDGITVRHTATNCKRVLPGFMLLIEREDKERRAKGDTCCTLCGRDEWKLLACGCCKKARYCPPGMRVCQKLDWPRHKKGCKA